ncbi:MAG: S-layer homology domain-containing protein [Selenomonadaceae bacterium]|nr:S-layer homology domain-containing protein [Selenomonadaceae bacterium]
MKKSLIKTLITALICGASATTFAAANPFSDVPVTHWAYKAVTELASAGIIEGYDGNNEDTNLNNKFVGNRAITRYELAQMVAKALAHVEQNETQLDPALMEELHRLTVEFHDDLKNLGVRVADLEEHSDNVSWHGKIRIWSERTHHDVNSLTGEKDTRSTNNVFLLRLEPSLKINKNWKIRSRIEACAQLREDSTGDLGLKRVWAEGTYGNNIFRAGRMPMGIDMDLLFETQFSGAQFVTGKNLKATFSAGRFDLNNASDYFKYGVNILDDNKADYQALSLQYKDTGKLTGGIAYHHLKSDAFSKMIDYGYKDHANILTANETAIIILTAMFICAKLIF